MRVTYSALELSLLEPITFDGDQGTLRLVVTANGRRGKAWVPVDGIKCGRTDVEYIALVDDDGGPVPRTQSISSDVSTGFSLKLKIKAKGKLFVFAQGALLITVPCGTHKPFFLLLW